MTAAQRREQIINVTLGAVAKHGVRGASTAGIAAAAGVSEKIIYVHFASRANLLRSAVDAAYDRATKLISIEETNALDRLRAIGEAKWDLLSDDKEGFVYPLFEFLAAPPELGLRDRIQARHRMTLDMLKEVIEQGQAQGTIRPEVDVEQTAWELLSVYMSEDLWYLSGASRAEVVGRPAAMLEVILNSLATAGVDAGNASAKSLVEKTPS
jgi:AcrR family transcriptional regulator